MTNPQPPTPNLQPPTPVVLSHFQAAPLLRAWQAGQGSAAVSPDLGLTTVEVALTAEGVRFAGGKELDWAAVGEIAGEPNKCFVLDSTGLHEIKGFSEATGRVYSLFPTVGAPTMLVSGFAMHRIKGTDPQRDTAEKVRAAAPVGRVLDTTTGLGYTAIAAARRADHVTTVELDPTALEIARQNPWSRDLFTNPRIQQLIGDSADLISTFAPGAFTRIIHDPPVFSLAGQLYSGAFYGELYRVLSKGGRVFHYIGDPDSKSGGSTTRGVVRRLLAAGFSRVTPAPAAYGVVATK